LGKPQITAELGRFIAKCESGMIPAHARKFALAGIVDCSGVLVAGSVEEAPRILEKTLAPCGQEARLYFGDRLTGVADAAWINATAAHALDFDDVAIQGHPSAVLVPALLAEAAVRKVTGSDVIEAYLVGYEVWAELVLRETDQHHIKGWHPTCLFGCIGAAAACARLTGLNADQATAALAIAASQSAGLVANFGSMAKPLHVGRAAHAGLLSARLAAAGATAARDAIEHPQGLLMAASPNGNTDLTRPVEAGKIWKILSHRLNIKRYPTCMSTMRGVDGIRELMTQHAIQVDDVAQVTVTMSRRNATILRHHNPKTALEAKFSMEFAAAAALTTGNLTLAELRDDFVRRPRIQDLMKNITVVAIDLEDLATGYAPSDKVSIQLHSGRTFETSVSQVPGANIPEEMLRHKFMECLRTGGFASSADRFYNALIALDQPFPVRQLMGDWL
jgi:2-methylcitrate dehydratase PrpD